MVLASNPFIYGKVHMKITRPVALAVASASAIVLAFVPAAQAASLVVGGASSVATVVADCKTEYTAKTGDSFAYASSSSGQGQKDMETGKDDFAFSDSAHLTSQSGTAIPASEIHVPAWVWPIGVMYNLNTKQQVAISYQNVAKIFSGQITKWNDPALQADNDRKVQQAIYKKDASGNVVKDAKGAPVVLRTVTLTQHITLPNQPITVIYRADSSGTTGNLTSAFAKFDSATWPKSSKVFTDLVKVSKDPIHFQGANGSAGVAQLAAKTKYSITYAEVNFAALNKSLALASIINPNGDLVQPTADAAAGFVASAPIADNGVVSLDYLNKGSGVYPFTVVTYALALTNYGDATKAAAVKRAIDYAAFGCTTAAPNDGFIQISPTSALGVKIKAQLAKLGK